MNVGRWVRLGAAPLVLAATTAAAPIPDFAAVVEGLACETLGADVFRHDGDAISGPLFLGSMPESKPLAATCENVAAWVLPMDAGLLVAVCDLDHELTAKDLERAKRRREHFERVSRKLAQTDERVYVSPRPPVQHETIASGRTLDFIDVLLIEHGVVPAPTVLLTDTATRRVVVAQVEVIKPCQSKPTLAICTDPKTALGTLARRVAATLGTEGAPKPSPSAAAPCRGS